MSALVDMWRREIGVANYRMTRVLSYHTWCPSDVLRALFHIHDAKLTYEATSRYTGRVHLWERMRNAGRMPAGFDLEAQIVRELLAEFPGVDLVALQYVKGVGC